MGRRIIGFSLATERSAILQGTIWISVLAASLAWNWRQVGDSMMVLAESEAISSFKKDLVYRHWASLHGGVYVPPTEATPPNPYLAHLPHRDVTTASGKQLTLVNPAYMTRQVHALGKSQFGLLGHITSLTPIRPENSPDAWETEALLAFQDGAEQATTVVTIGDSTHFRLMRPLLVQESCMACHTDQGYAAGDVIVGISVSLPLADYMKQVGRQRAAMASIHVLLGFSGLIGIGIGHRLLRRTETKLRASEEHLAATLRSIGDGVIACDREGRVTSLNRVAETLTGWTTAEAAGRTIGEVFRIIHARTRETAKNPVTRALAEGVIVGLANHTALIARNGTEHQIADSCAPIRDAGGTVTGAVLVFRDVTEEYRRRDEIAQSASLLSATLESTADGILVINTDGIMSLYNQRFVEMWHIPRTILKDNVDETMLQYVVRQMANPEDFLTKVRELYDTPEASSVDLLNLADGRAFESYSQPQRQGEKIVGRVWSFRDITEKETAKQSLVENERRLNAILSNTPAVIYTYTIDRDGLPHLTYINENVERILGYKPHEFIESMELWENCVHPEDMPKMQEKLSGKSMSNEYRFKNKEGNYHWLLDNQQTMNHKDGEAQLIGTWLDITDRKEADELLAKSEDRFQRAISGAGAGLWDWDMVKNTVYFSPQWKMMLGYEDHEIPNDFSGWRDLWHPEDAARIEKYITDFIEARTSVY
jgi:PAS domain S-box-containing protein